MLGVGPCEIWPNHLEEFRAGMSGLLSIGVGLGKALSGPALFWASAVRTKKGALRIPEMLRAILMFLASRFGDGGELLRLEEDLIFYNRRQGDGQWSLDRWLQAGRHRAGLGVVLRRDRRLGTKRIQRGS